LCHFLNNKNERRNSFRIDITIFKHSKKTMFGSSLPPVVCGSVHVLFSFLMRINSVALLSWSCDFIAWTSSKGSCDIRNMQPASLIFASIYRQRVIIISICLSC
jgi:hypothetical protein